MRRNLLGKSGVRYITAKKENDTRNRMRLGMTVMSSTAQRPFKENLPRYLSLFLCSYLNETNHHGRPRRDDSNFASMNVCH
eukprot:scaffold184_cov179-Amphora_coffeaeformis.AAC.24